MATLIVVNNPADWPLQIPGVTVIAARAYLTDPGFGIDRSHRVFNLCKSYRYQSFGYYVSLLAEARGHRPLPRVNAIEDLQSHDLVRLLGGDLDALMQKSLAPLKSDAFVLSIYFGRNLAGRHDCLSRRLFDLLQAPMLRAHFERDRDHWRIRSVRPIAANEIPPTHQDFVVRAASDYFSRRTRRPRRQQAPRFELAILRDPANAESASNPRALRKFQKAAQELGIHAEIIGQADMGRLTEFDALFLRDTTFVDHYTNRFSRRAAAEGLVVIDDPDSILRCNNKVYLAELLMRHGIAGPKTLLVHRDNVGRIVAELGLPCVLKQPDSSMSLGVIKAESRQELKDKVSTLLAKSDLIVAQEYLPTPFDWRVGILDRRALFVCRYYMAPGHWQIIKRDRDTPYCEGPTEAIGLAAAPRGLIALAMKAANLFGDGFYGVDIKQVGRRFYVVEVNDNPNVDAGNEDGVLGDALYVEVMATFLRRLEARGRGGGR